MQAIKPTDSRDLEERATSDSITQKTSRNSEKPVVDVKETILML